MRIHLFCRIFWLFLSLLGDLLWNFLLYQKLESTFLSIQIYYRRRFLIVSSQCNIFSCRNSRCPFADSRGRVGRTIKYNWTANKQDSESWNVTTIKSQDFSGRAQRPSATRKSRGEATRCGTACGCLAVRTRLRPHAARQWPYEIAGEKGLY